MITIAEKEQAIPPILRMPFRILFFSAALFSAVAIGIWTAFINSQIALTPYGSVMWWHTHEMLLGFVSAIVVGFLNTAVQTWTGQRAVHGYPLLGIALLWIAARLLLLFPLLPHWMIAVIDLLFIPIMGWLLAQRLWHAKQFQNMLFLPLLLLLTLSNALSHYAALVAPSYTDHALSIALYVILTVVSVVSGRVIPFFTSRALGVPMKQKKVWLESSASLAILLLLATNLFSLNSLMVSLVASIACVLQLVRFSRWQGLFTFKQPILWSLHLAYLFVIFGLALEALAYHTAIPRAIYWHAYGIGGMGLLILSMMSRVSLGHSGKALKLHWSIAYAYLSLIACAFFRIIVAWLPAQLIGSAYSLSGILWCCAFAIFLWVYSPLFFRARADGHTG